VCCYVVLSHNIWSNKSTETLSGKELELSGVKTVLSKIDATSKPSKEDCRAGDAIDAGLQSALSVAAKQSGSEPHRPRGVGDPTRECVQAPPDHGRGRTVPACRGGGMGPSGPGSD